MFLPADIGMVAGMAPILTAPVPPRGVVVGAVEARQCGDVENRLGGRLAINCAD